jgi:hypothetical protein
MFYTTGAMAVETGAKCCYKKSFCMHEQSDVPSPIAGASVQRLNRASSQLSF